MRPRLLVVAFNGRGHLIPAIRLSKILVSTGFHVTFVSSLTHISAIDPQLLNPADLPHIHPIALPLHHLPSLNIHSAAGPIQRTPSILANMAKLSLAMSTAFNQLIDAIMRGSGSDPFSDQESVYPLAIISDNFCPWTQAVAEELGIPRYVLFTSPLKLLAVEFFYPSLVAKGTFPLMHLNDEDRSFDHICFPELGLVPLRELPRSLTEPSKIAHQFFHSIACLLHKASGVLINSFDELESNALNALKSESLNPKRVPILPIGPLLPDPYFSAKISHGFASHRTRPENIRLTEWLDQQSPSSVMYISFGSVCVPSHAQIYAISVGLEASHVPFLWALPSAASLNSAAIASDTVNILPEGFEQRTLNQGLVVTNWVSQVLILSHASIGGFLTHCGWNSTLESISYGVPMVAFPQFAEQELNCSIIVDTLKVGVRLERGEDGCLSGDGLEKVVKRLFGRSEEAAGIRRRSAEVSEAARRATAMTHENGSASRSSYLQEFVRNVIKYT